MPNYCQYSKNSFGFMLLYNIFIAGHERFADKTDVQKSRKAVNYFKEILSSTFFLNNFMRHFKSLSSQKMLFSFSTFLKHSEETYPLS